MGLFWGKNDWRIKYKDLEGVEVYFQIDFGKIRLNVGNGIRGHPIEEDFEIDGKGHKDKPDKWKDAIKNSEGTRGIHVPGEVTEEEHWSYLDMEIAKARASPSMTYYVDG